MSNNFLKHKEAYLTEARTLLKEMNNGLLSLEKQPENQKHIQKIFRATHTLKSMSAAMEFHHTSKLCHVLEDYLEGIRQKKYDVKNAADILFKSFDFIEIELNEIEQNDKEIEAKAITKDILHLLKENATATISKVQSIEVKSGRLDTLLKLVEELLGNKMKLEAIRNMLDNSDLSAIVESLGRVINDLQYNIMQIRMISVDFIFNQFPRMVRDLAKNQGKKVELQIEGGDIELDRTIIEEISESLVHLLRNAIDHGLETPEERKKLGKDPTGTLKLIASRNKETVLIEVSDDGRGLNLPAIKKEALKKGFIKEDASSHVVMNSIFAAISTSKSITDISGRGLGLDIVKKKIESIDGSIIVRSVPNKGTSFLIEIPLSLAVLKALFVKVNNRIYAIPLSHIERLVIVSQQDIKNMLNNNAILLDEENIPLLHLQPLFNKAMKDRQEKNLLIVVVKKDQQKLALGVDELLTTQELVIKPLNHIVKETRYFSGSAIIGSGEIVLIIDVNQLFGVGGSMQSRKMVLH